MAELPLLLLGQVIVDVVLLPLQLVDLPWVMGRPSSFSARARAIHSRRQVVNFLSGEKIYSISRLA